MLNFIKNITPTEFTIIALIIVILFGSKVAINLGKTSGETLKQIKKVKKSITDSIEDDESDKKS